MASSFTLLRPTLCYGSCLTYLVLCRKMALVPYELSKELLHHVLVQQGRRGYTYLFQSHHAYTCVRLITFRTLRYMPACSKNTSEIALEIAAEIANDCNFPGLQVVACVILVCKFKINLL
ncbi:hypothetical protein P692DRAFT_20227690 [Suillus brevipes Sb2]|nr:hypothetical protein P692DRAFT_20227690 [Suillus brevipes Sb2]